MIIFTICRKQVIIFQVSSHIKGQKTNKFVKFIYKFLGVVHYISKILKGVKALILLQAQNVARYFGGSRLFSNLSLTIQDRDRIALVGKNGSGKSSLLKILAGEEAPDEGLLSAAKNIQIGYLAQRTGIISQKSIWEEMLSVFDEVIQIEADMRELEQKLAQEDVLNNEELYRETLKHYDMLQNKFKDMNGYSYKSEIKAVLGGFHFYEEDYDTIITELSGGQKTRLALAKLLLEKPDLLILDEPTNHLDMDTLTWLEGYLKSYPSAILIVSHDRYFLDELVNEVYDLSYGKITHYSGDYSNYLSEKEKNIEKQWKDFEHQQKEIQKLEEFVQKNISRATTSKRAQSRQKQLEKIERLEKPLTYSKSADILFKPDQESGDLVLQVNNLTVGYDNIPTAQNINFEVRRKDIIAIVGPNGVGKSTLLKTIVGKLEALAGEVINGTKVDIGYYDQEQENLTQNKTILNELWDEHPTMNEESIRSLLGSFLFSGDDVLKTIHSLSGGEKARVALAKLALNHDNFLILDEPTNHLDIDSKEALENALLHFEGTILFVSHDRYFINRLATEIIEIHADQSTLYLGNYDYYIEKKQELEEIQQLTESKDEEQPAESVELSEASLDRQELKDRQREQRRLEREVEALEIKILELEEENESIHADMLKPEVYNDPEKSFTLGEQLNENTEMIDKWTQEWEIVAMDLEELLS